MYVDRIRLRQNLIATDDYVGRQRGEVGAFRINYRRPTDSRYDEIVLRELPLTASAANLNSIQCGPVVVPY
jgi:hypothetical protein